MKVPEVETISPPADEGAMTWLQCQAVDGVKKVNWLVLILSNKLVGLPQIPQADVSEVSTCNKIYLI